jgi:hypothetical protein
MLGRESYLVNYLDVQASRMGKVRAVLQTPGAPLLYFLQESDSTGECFEGASVASSFKNAVSDIGVILKLLAPKDLARTIPDRVGSCPSRAGSFASSG